MHKKCSIIFFFLKWLLYVNREYSIKREFSSYQHYFILQMRIWELQKLNNPAKGLWFMNGKAKIVNQVPEVQVRPLLQSHSSQGLTSMKDHHKYPGAWWVVQVKGPDSRSGCLAGPWQVLSTRWWERNAIVGTVGHWHLYSPHSLSHTGTSVAGKRLHIHKKEGIASKD